jgi:hypothetical protein
MGAPKVFNPHSYPWLPLFDKEHIGIDEQLKQLDPSDLAVKAISSNDFRSSVYLVEVPKSA